MLIKKAYLSFLLFSCLCISNAIAQDYNVDSLKETLNHDLPDTARVNNLNNIAHGLMRKGKLKEAINYAKQALAFAKKTENKRGIGNAYNALGNAYGDLSDGGKALENHLKALAIREEIKDKRGIAGSYNNIGIIYYNLSDFPKAIEYIQKGLKIQEELGNNYYVAACMGNIAVLYGKLGEDSLSLQFQKKSFELHKAMGNKSDMVASLNHLGSIYRSKKQFEVARDYLDQAKSIAYQIDELKGKSEVHGNFGLLYFDLGKYDEAIKEFEKGLSFSTELGEKKIQTEQLNMIGNTFTAMKKPHRAMSYYRSAYEIAVEIQSLEDQLSSAEGLYKIYRDDGNTKDALFFHEQLTNLRDSIFNATKNKAFESLKTQFALDRQETEFKLQADAEAKKQEEEKKQQRYIVYGIIFILVLVSIFSYFLYQRFRLTNKQNKIIEQQKVMVEIKNKEVTDSITYAKRIQNAILPEWELKERMFSDSFILYHPRDIVSGDFYWYAEKHGKKLIAAVDCTGHGVPGAFMSMIGNAFLNQVVNEKGITTPGEILAELRNLVIKALKQTGESGEQRDGMDISLLSVNGMKAEWAGANNALWIIRNGEIIEYKGDKRPIGYFLGRNLPFQNHSIDLQTGDALYILTDGFADQFGGPKGKKFKYSHLKKLLLSIQDQTMEDQHKVLMHSFIEWQGVLEQVDDVCVIGIRI